MFALCLPVRPSTCLPIHLHVRLAGLQFWVDSAQALYAFTDNIVDI
jgi:hypothetical protein